jgi:hypothetical protein
MTAVPPATICILTYGDHLAYFRRCLDSVLAHTPAGAFELRLGFNEAPVSFHYALGRLCPTGVWIERQELPGGVERLRWSGPDDMSIRAWNSPTNLFKYPMARLLYYDAPLTTEYAVWFDDDTYVDAGWWDGLRQLFEKKIDYIGQQWGVWCYPGQAEMIQAQPWYRGVPLAFPRGQLGVTFMTGGFVAARVERLREVNYPDPSWSWKGDRLKHFGGDTLLGEIARQLGWSRAEHYQGVHVNVDLNGKHPAPRRGGTGRHFGSAVDKVIT